MCKHMAIAAVFVAELLLCQAAVPARPIARWSYDKLLKESDLVVFATAVKTESADDKASENPWPYEFAAQNTTFKVKHALKGKVEGEQIKVLHFKFGELKKGLDTNSLKDTMIINGPDLVTFRTEPVTVTVGKDQRVLPAPEYLLFLRRRMDGRYEPVSGRIDPVLSVKEIYEASDTVLGDK